jgi:hypothetical protein
MEYLRGSQRELQRNGTVGRRSLTNAGCLPSSELPSLLEGPCFAVWHPDDKLHLPLQGTMLFYPVKHRTGTWLTAEELCAAWTEALSPWACSPPPRSFAEFQTEAAHNTWRTLTWPVQAAIANCLRLCLTNNRNLVFTALELGRPGSRPRQILCLERACFLIHVPLAVSSHGGRGDYLSGVFIKVLIPFIRLWWPDHQPKATALNL